MATTAIVVNDRSTLLKFPKICLNYDNVNLPITSLSTIVLNIIALIHFYLIWYFHNINNGNGLPCPTLVQNTLMRLLLACVVPVEVTLWQATSDRFNIEGFYAYTTTSLCIPNMYCHEAIWQINILIKWLSVSYIETHKKSVFLWPHHYVAITLFFLKGKSIRRHVLVSYDRHDPKLSSPMQWITHRGWDGEAIVSFWREPKTVRALPLKHCIMNRIIPQVHIGNTATSSLDCCVCCSWYCMSAHPPNIGAGRLVSIVGPIIPTRHLALPLHQIIVTELKVG